MEYIKVREINVCPTLDKKNLYTYSYDVSKSLLIGKVPHYPLKH